MAAATAVPLVRKRAKAGHYQLWQGDRLRAEILHLQPRLRGLDCPDAWLVYLDGDTEHWAAGEGRTLAHAEANARHGIAWKDANPLRWEAERSNVIHWFLPRVP